MGNKVAVLVPCYNEELTVSDVIRDFGEKRVDFDIPTDGAVIKPIEEARLYNAMGNTAHHPKAFIAFKPEYILP